MDIDTLDNFATNMAYEVGLNYETAISVVTWLNNEAILDYPIVNEIYAEPKPKAANDA